MTLTFSKNGIIKTLLNYMEQPVILWLFRKAVHLAASIPSARSQWRNKCCYFSIGKGGHRYQSNTLSARTRPTKERYDLDQFRPCRYNVREHSIPSGHWSRHGNLPWKAWLDDRRTDIEIHPWKFSPSFGYSTAKHTWLYYPEFNGVMQLRV
jgi:hypothetical protein